MGLFDLFWNLHQQRRLDEAQSAIDRGATKAESTRYSIDELQAAVNRLVLVNQALWELVSEKTGLTEADLVARVEEIDLRDGVLDGRIRKVVLQCPQCQRRNAGERRLCLYCGTPLDISGSPRVTG